MKTIRYHLIDESVRYNAIQFIRTCNLDLIVEVKQRTRSLDQNRRLWATLRDVSEQVVWHGAKLNSEDWKHIFTAALKGQRSAPGINGGFVVLGQSTSKMRVSEFSELLELIHAFGAERDVRWSEDAQEAIEWAKRTGRKVAA
ncbi:recombination protein NinB [Cronobacter malonaticus]|nr:recombination protein NinB [Cronobacter malonaticus]EGT4298776.1 recombination protein NinB [Cronobacter malonaticus]